MATHVNLTRALWHNDIIVWPENALPSFPHNIESVLKLLNGQVKKNHATLLSGIPVWQNGSYYNGVIALNGQRDFYLKRHLVPFGEYVPFASILRGLIHLFDLPMSDFAVGPPIQPLLEVKNIPFSTLICYEIAFERVLKMDLPAAQFLLTISDDSWFGSSFALPQHLQIAQFRAQQIERPVIFAGNNGITAIINAKGDIIKQLPPFQAGALQGQITTMIGQTPWVRFGSTWQIVLLFAGLAFFFVDNYYKLRKLER